MPDKYCQRVAKQHSAYVLAWVRQKELKEWEGPSPAMAICRQDVVTSLPCLVILRHIYQSKYQLPKVSALSPFICSSSQEIWFLAVLLAFVPVFLGEIRSFQCLSFLLRTASVEKLATLSETWESRLSLYAPILLFTRESSHLLGLVMGSVSLRGKAVGHNIS